MNELVKARGYTKAKITYFKNYIDKVIASSPDRTKALDEIKRLEIAERLNTIREVNNKYELQTKIDEISNDVKEIVEYRENFEEEYYHVVAQAQMLLARGNTVHGAMDATNIGVQNTIQQPEVQFIRDV